MIDEMTPRRTRSTCAIALLLAISIGCTFDPPPPSAAARAWVGCYRGGDPETGLILEPVLDEAGADTTMLTGCLRIGIGRPNPRMATLAGVAEAAFTLEMSDGEEIFLLTRDIGEPEIDDTTITIASGDRSVGPIPLCAPEQIRTCEEILSGMP